jgi:hypothetical protein
MSEEEAAERELQARRIHESRANPNDCHGRQRLSKLPLRVTLWSLVKLLVSYRREATLVKKADSCTHYGTFSCFPASLGETCGVSLPPFCDAL